MSSHTHLLPNAAGRSSVLERLRDRKMAQSVHAYVRGNTLRFYEWLESASGRTLPKGPAVWICGDCHLGNLGPVGDSDGKIGIQIRDLDQTVIGNPAHDLVRLGLSLTTAALSSNMPGVATARMLAALVDGYRYGLLHPGDRKHAKLPKAVRGALRESHRRTWRQLAEDCLGTAHPTIPLGKRFWPLSRAERLGMERLFATERVRRLVTSLQARDAADPIELLDSAYWVKGCSSLGRLRFAALVKVGNHEQSEVCLIDLKEAARPCAPRYPHTGIPRDDARRVIQGARHLAPYLGQRMLAESLQERPMVMRELRPQDMKLEISRLTPGESLLTASFLGGVVGRAHARQLDVQDRRHWAAELITRKPKKIDAPLWLWQKVIELAADHEAAYLEHCRRLTVYRSAA